MKARRSRVPGHSHPQGEFQATVGYIRFHLKQNKTKKKQKTTKKNQGIHVSFPKAANSQRSYKIKKHLDCPGCKYSTSLSL